MQGKATTLAERAGLVSAKSKVQIICRVLMSGF